MGLLRAVNHGHETSRRNRYHRRGEDAPRIHPAPGTLRSNWGRSNRVTDIEEAVRRTTILERSHGKARNLLGSPAGHQRKQLTTGQVCSVPHGPVNSHDSYRTVTPSSRASARSRRRLMDAGGVGGSSGGCLLPSTVARRRAYLTGRWTPLARRATGGPAVSTQPHSRAGSRVEITASWTSAGSLLTVIRMRGWSLGIRLARRYDGAGTPGRLRR